ncbi:TetR/AcrR family transcriptional regulator [Eubacteriaceae bacterium ES2]|nr:TetR/AcrR family transcriptional regulator [Eubacteriaceae bacterium ES2]
MAEKKKPEERKNEILDVSEKLFKENGYERTSIEQILKELKLSKGDFIIILNQKKKC